MIDFRKRYQEEIRHKTWEDTDAFVEAVIEAYEAAEYGRLWVKDLLFAEEQRIRRLKHQLMLVTEHNLKGPDTPT